MARILGKVAGVLLALGLMAPAGAWAASDEVVTPHMEARLIPEGKAIQPGETFTVGLRQIIKDGWHTYWKNPGDSGEATAIEWNLPEGFKVGPIQWPHPERIPTGPLVNFGYAGTVTLLVDITAPKDLVTGASVILKADASWLVCEDVCIPEEGSFELAMPVTDGMALHDSRWSEDFRAARAALPQTTPWPAAFQADANTFNLFIPAPEIGRRGASAAVFFPDKPDLIRNAADQLVDVRVQGVLIRTEAGRLLTMKDAPPLTDVSGVLVVTPRDGGPKEAYQIQALEGPMPILPISADTLGAPQSDTSWPMAILFAFLGGVILNLMPCVFPILSMKAFTFMSKAGKELSSARAEALVYSLGAVLSFVAIGGLLLTLREAGAEIGWGFQLQSPLIVTLLALLFLVVGLNLSGVFEFGGGLQDTGRGLMARSGMIGAFFTGVLAVVVAAPCTAPFMAVAIGWAVVQPSWIAQSVFAMLGLGMALPFLVLAVFPRLISVLPKPGLWMLRLKEFLAFPMYGSAAWLVWVLTEQLGADGLVIALTAGVLVAFAAWAFGVAQRDGGTLPFASAGLGAVIAMTILWILPSMPVPARESSLAAQTGNGPVAEVFSPERLDQMRAGNKPVFVNLTAAWCITCLVNEQVALSSKTVADAFRDKGVAYLKGDWTNRDPVITRVLEAYGRSGVPLYLYYAPGAAKAEILPQILTEGMVLETIEGKVAAQTE